MALFFQPLADTKLVLRGAEHLGDLFSVLVATSSELHAYDSFASPPHFPKLPHDWM